MKSNWVDGTEMSLDTANFFFKDHVVESGIKLANTSARSCDIHGLLTTTKHNLQGEHEERQKDRQKGRKTVE